MIAEEPAGVEKRPVPGATNERVPHAILCWHMRTNPNGWLLTAYPVFVFSSSHEAQVAELYPDRCGRALPPRDLSSH